LSRFPLFLIQKPLPAKAKGKDESGTQEKFTQLSGGVDAPNFDPASHPHWNRSYGLAHEAAQPSFSCFPLS
jgi:hypothetical protein